MNGKRIGIGMAGAGAAALCAASVAWACTYQPHMVATSSDNGLANSPVTVSGQVAPAKSLVEIHWNGEAGPLLGAAPSDASGNFTETVRIPADAAPNVYFLMGVVDHAAVVRTAFEVTAPAPASGASSPARAAEGDVWNGFSTSSSNALRGASMAGNGDSGISPMMIAGAGLVAVTALGGTVLALTTRRRRVAASGGSRS